MKALTTVAVFVGFSLPPGGSPAADEQAVSVEQAADALKLAYVLRRSDRCDGEGGALAVLDRAENLLIKENNVDSGLTGRLNEERGHCLDDLGHPIDAKAAYMKAARDHRDSRLRERALQAAEDLHRRYYGTLEVSCDAPVGVASVQVVPPEGEVLPAQPCKSAWPDLPVGLYTIVGTSEDGIRIQEARQVTPGRKTNVQLRFRASLDIDGPTGRPVKINGEVVGDLPLRRDGMENGTYQIEVELEDGDVYARTVTLTAGRRITLKVQDAPEPPPLAPVVPPPVVDDSADDLRIMLPWALVAGAVGAGALGGIFLYRGERAEDDAVNALKDYNTLCPDPEPLNCGRDQQQQLEVYHRRGIASLEDASTDRTAGWIAIGTSAALLGAATWLLLDTWPASLGVVGIEPADGGASLRLRGTF